MRPLRPRSFYNRRGRSITGRRRIGQPYIGVNSPNQLGDMELRLLTMLQLVNDWLVFAEAKNAGLVALVGASMTAILTILSLSLDIPTIISAALVWCAVFLSVGLILSLFSFIPSRSPHIEIEPSGKVAPPGLGNVYYYGDLAAFPTGEALIRSVIQKHDLGPSCSKSGSAACIDLALQVIINARIATRKFKLFAIAAALGCVAILPVPFVILVAIFW